MPFDFDTYIPGFRDALPWLGGLDTPWAITARAEALIRDAIAGLGGGDTGPMRRASASTGPPASRPAR